MGILIIAAILFCILFPKVKRAREQKRIQAEIEENRRSTDEILRRVCEERIQRDAEARRIAAIEAAQKRQLAEQKRIYTEQERQRKEQERIAKEQERQAKAQERLEAEQEKMRHTLEKATSDIDFLQERQADLYAQLDYQLLLQAGTIPGSKPFEKCQGKIVSLRNQLHTVESKLSDAEWHRDTARRKLA